MNRDLVERRDKVEERRCGLCRGREKIIDTWGGKLSMAAGGFEFLVVDRNGTLLPFLGMRTNGLKN